MSRVFLILLSIAWTQSLLLAQADPNAAHNAMVDELYRLHDVGNELMGQGKVKDALAAYNRSLILCKKVLSPNHQATAQVLQSMGMVLNELGEFQAAQSHYEQALAMRRAVFGNNHYDTAISMNDLAALLMNQGDYKEARKLFEESLAVRIKLLGAEHAEIAPAWINLGSLDKREGNFPAAKQNFLKGLAIAEKKLGPEHPYTLATLNNLGDLSVDMADYVSARQYWDRVLPLAKKAFGENDSRVAMVLNNLGHLHQIQGNYAAAKQSYEQALKIRKAGSGANHPETASVINNIGHLIQSQGDHAGAIPYYQEALTMLRKTLGDEHQLTVSTLGSLGTAKQKTGDYKNGRRSLEEALRLYRKILGEKHPLVAVALTNLAWMNVAERDVKTAHKQLETALEIQTASLGAGHPDTLSTRQDIAMLDALNGKFYDAAQQLDTARRGIKQHIGRTLSGLSEQEQITYMRVNDDKSFQDSLSLGYAQRHDQKLVELSTSWLLNGKALTPSLLAERALMLRDAKTPELAKLGEDLSQVRRQLASLSMSSQETNEVEERRKSLDQLTAEEERLSRAISSKNGSGGSGKYRWLELADLRKKIPANSVLIDIMRLREVKFQADIDESRLISTRYIAWIIPPEAAGRIEIVDLGDVTQVEPLLRKVRDQLTTAAQPNGPLIKQGEAEATKSLTTELAQVGELVWKPLAEKIPAGTTELIISPDGELWTLPWAALPITDNKLLIEDYAVRFVTNARSLFSGALAAKNPGKPLIFSDPDFDLAGEAVRAAILAVFPDLKLNNSTRGLTSRTSLPRVTSLPNTKIEAEAVIPSIEKLTENKPVNYTGKFALESVVKRVNRPRMMLLTTHGFFLDDQSTNGKRDALETADQRSLAATGSTKGIENPLLRCGLLFAGCNAKQNIGDDDGVLTGLEIVGLDLRGTELVVLSACETGLGKVNNGQGIAGLRQAFQIAGARSVVATLWQVPDRDSAILMTDFFGTLADGNPAAQGSITAAALREAQLKRIATRREKSGAAHPFYWAAWTVTGN
jgi:CHAT domain-containing protein/tetratricopeptide (TPR) repeat protein